MIFLKDNEEIGFWVHLHLAWCKRCLEHLLGELLAKVLNLQDPESILTNCHEAIRMRRGTERAHVLERLIADWCHSVLTHVVVAKPRLVGEGDHRILTILLNFCQFDTPGA